MLLEIVCFVTLFEIHLVMMRQNHYFNNLTQPTHSSLMAIMWS